MNTIILNGSPKGNSKNCNSRIFAEEFIRNMKNPCEIKCIAKADPKELARYVVNFDVIIIILPLYIHAMPGIVMKFIEMMEPATNEGKYLGFIIQAGFIETSQERFVERYFADLARQLNYKYLGTVSKGEAAGTYMFPKMFKKVLKLVSDLGVSYEETHAFDRDIVQKLGKPYELTKFQVGMFGVANKLGLSNIGWHKFLRQNNALDKRLDRPFL
jgi:hypothetical protein